MRLKFVNRALLASVLVIGLALIPVVAFAEHGSDDSTAPDSSVSDTTDTSTTSDGTMATDTSENSSTENETHIRSMATAQEKELEAEHAVKADHRLTTGKLKSCEARTKAINNIMNRIVTRGTKQTELFSTIATRTEDFYVKQGKTLSNYGELVAAVNNAKTTAQTDLQTLKDENTFSCDSSNPKGQIAAFRAALKTEIADLKAFKTAVKNLIVGVKSVQSTTSSSTGGVQ